MGQRGTSSYRYTDEHMTPPWVAGTVAPWLRERGVRRVWEPAPGTGGFGRALEELGFAVLTTSADFFLVAPVECDALVTNPPYGRGGVMAADFARRGIRLGIARMALLLPIDFDSAKTRRDLFADCPSFAGKIVLLNRIVFFERPGASPASNHAWFLWDRAAGRVGSPQIRYAGRDDIR